MHTETISNIKKELQHRSHEELTNLCLRLARFKKENKELLTYLLFESHDEQGYIDAVKMDMDSQFEQINTNSYFYIKKSVRKILRSVQKYIRYSLKKETEVELLLYFCHKLKDFSPSIFENVTLNNLFERQINGLKKKISVLHEDLQYDYTLELEALSE
ncbi:hypothetical protein [Mangrovimonas sp. DI 80]|uniref:hypothetical protein n=1 Tax=Mangrovimonas sp. DI 80 TaxID=1779330 RepID=UPI000978272B|nr:hypothetical protein [Mangrovimonas sp. DI 80]OMP30093.1 hypothetical protein BKM32_14550 [Mangrovimonas sp. DI 80]